MHKKLIHLKESFTFVQFWVCRDYLLRRRFSFYCLLATLLMERSAESYLSLMRRQTRTIQHTNNACIHYTQWIARRITEEFNFSFLSVVSYLLCLVNCFHSSYFNYCFEFLGYPLYSYRLHLFRYLHKLFFQVFIFKKYSFIEAFSEKETQCNICPLLLLYPRRPEYPKSRHQMRPKSKSSARRRPQTVEKIPWPLDQVRRAGEGPLYPQTIRRVVDPVLSLVMRWVY